MLITAGVAALVLAALLVPALFENDTEQTITTPTTEWTRAYVYDGATGQGVAIDPDGNVVESYVEMGRFIESRVVARSRSIAFLSDESIEIGPIPRSKAGSGNYTIDVPEGSITSVLGVPDRLVLAINNENRGNIVIVDVDARQTLDLGALLDLPDPQLTLSQLQLEPTGQQFAIYDREADRTAVVSFQKPEPTFFAGRGVGITSDRLIATQIEDGETTLTVFNLSGEKLRSLPIEPLVSATMDGHTAYLVTTGNKLLRLTDDDSEPTSLAVVPDAEQVVVAADGERLVVDSPWGFSFLAADGSELGQLTPDERGVENPSRYSRCIAAGVAKLVTPGGAQGSDSNVTSGPVLLRLDDLSLVGVPNLPLHSSTPTGCTAAASLGDQDELRLLSADEQLSLATATADQQEGVTVGPYRRLFLSPNPNQWVALMPDGTIELIELQNGQPTTIAKIPFPAADYITASFVTVPVADGAEPAPTDATVADTPETTATEP